MALTVMGATPIYITAAVRRMRGYWGGVGGSLRIRHWSF